jgi:hypothetical protein
MFDRRGDLALEEPAAKRPVSPCDSEYKFVFSDDHTQARATCQTVLPAARCAAGPIVLEVQFLNASTSRPTRRSQLDLINALEISKIRLTTLPRSARYKG